MSVALFTCCCLSFCLLLLPVLIFHATIRNNDRRGAKRVPETRGAAHSSPRDGQRGRRRARARLPRKSGPDHRRQDTAGVSRSAHRAARARPLRELLEGIGVPAPAPFKPDAFQLEALAALEREDVLVTAPTGSGKTWIAREEVRRLLAAGRRAWYTSPLKALTNSKYQEFSAEFGAESVGILTGDRKEKADAPLIIGTTEVYRNQLFDALRGGREVEADLVVLDEAHYLADEERGHVWEEAIILTPPRVRLLLLSATVGGAEEFAAWIEEVRGVRCGVVSRPGARPVPLRAGFLYPDENSAALDAAGRFMEIEQFVERRTSVQCAPTVASTNAGAQGRPPQYANAALDASRGAKSYDLLPAILFLPTRRRCDEAAAEAALAPRGGGGKKGGGGDEGRREGRRALLQELAETYPEIRRHRHWEMAVRGGVASHHAGHLPAWKLAIERLMSAGLLDAILATATVAEVLFPARTVDDANIDVRTGRGGVRSRRRSFSR